MMDATEPQSVAQGASACSGHCQTLDGWSCNVRGSTASRPVLYRSVAAALRARIRDGIYPPGSRLPGLRGLSEQFSVSLSTAIAAVRLLEDEGRVEGRERSGFFVLSAPQGPQCEADGHGRDAGPATINNQRLMLDLLRASMSARFAQLGVAMPHHSFLPVQPLQRAFRQTARWRKGQPVGYSFPPGVKALREQVCRRLARAGC